jgi:hypothetical protein
MIPLASQLGIFLVYHLWCFDRFRCLRCVVSILCLHFRAWFERPVRWNQGSQGTFKRVMTVRDTWSSNRHGPCLISILVRVLAERALVNNIRCGLQRHQIFRGFYRVAWIRKCAYYGLQFSSLAHPSQSFLIHMNCGHLPTEMLSYPCIFASHAHGGLKCGSLFHTFVLRSFIQHFAAFPIKGHPPRR